MTTAASPTLHFVTYQLSVEPLSPIHIGSGLTIEPSEYVLAKDKNGDEILLAIDLPRLLSELSPALRAEFDDMLGRNDWTLIRKWLHQHASQKHARFTVRVQPDAYSEIARHQDNPARLGEIHLFTRDARSGRPYIPGSSLKGAIRTAIVDKLCVDADGNDRADLRHWESKPRETRKFEGRETRKFEGDVLGNRGNLYRDPLRQLAFSDLPVAVSHCYIDQIKVVPTLKARAKPGRAQPEGIVIYRDMTWSLLDGARLRWAGQARHYPKLNDPRLMHTDDHNRGPQDNHLTERLEIDAICRWCNDFYGPRLQDECTSFIRDNDITNALLGALSSMKPNQCLIRLGHHSHFECVTVGAPYQQPPPKGFGKTRSYAAGQLPLGWARLTFDQAKG